MRPGILEEMTISDVRSLDPNVCVFPIGSTEPHGPRVTLRHGQLPGFGETGICRGGSV